METMTAEIQTTALEPLGLVLSRLPQTEQEWQQVPAWIRQGRGVLVVNNVTTTTHHGVALEKILEQFARTLGHELLKYDRWPGQSPAVAGCTKLALLGNYKARHAQDIVVDCVQGDAIAEYKPATLELSEWHTDGSFLARPKTYIALYAPPDGPLPAEGGETRFCSTHVSEHLQQKFAGWTSVHSWETFMRFLEQRNPKRPKMTAAQCAAKPDQTWPLVTNSGHLYINPKNTKAVYDEEGKAVDENPAQFVYDLCQQLLEQNGVYWHKWKPGQLVLWDNHVLLHAATPFDATKYERLLYRAEFGPHHVACRPETVTFGYLDAATPPVLTVESGAVVVVDTVNASMVPPQNVQDEFERIPPELFQIHDTVTDRLGPHILTGPIAVEGAQLGDVLQVDILHVKLRSDWAYTRHKPSMELRHTKLFETGWAETPWGSRLECQPFFGVLGVAPPGDHRVSSVEPSELYGGNLDLKLLTACSTLYLPVHVAGARFFVGDGHARQGHGECCGTALETSLTGTFRLTLVKKNGNNNDKPLATTVRAETAAELITIGVAKTVDAAVASALDHMVEWLQQEEDESSSLGPALSRVDAECLCSIAGDLAVTQIVNGTTRGAHMTLQKRHLPPKTNDPDQEG